MKLFSEDVHLIFLDSLNFLQCSLEKLAENLSDNESHYTNQISENPEIVSLAKQKGIYPYDYIDSVDKFNETALPPIEKFYSILKASDISQKEYEHATKVWTAIQAKDIGDYHDFYLKSDVLILADVFSQFKTLVRNKFGLDPLQYVTLPGLAFDCLLKSTKTRIKLLTNEEEYEFFERQIRGGICNAVKRSAEATENRKILYIDANNLYGKAMCEYLPVGDFNWLTSEEIKNFDLSKISKDSDIGYTLEVDLEIPTKLHDYFGDLPPAPEKLIITEEELSSYQKKYDKKRAKVEKMMLTLHPKKNYVIHYRLLQLYVQLGVKITKIHKIISYKQEPWIKSYIEQNNECRKKSKSNFEKNFWKLLNNSVYGKTIEDVRRRTNIDFASNEKQLQKLVEKPFFKYCKFLSEDFCLVQHEKSTVFLKPIYVGATILDLSKLVMYDFLQYQEKFQYRINLHGHGLFYI